MAVLDLIDEKQNTKHYSPILFKVLPLNNSQEQAIKEVEKNTLTTVIGAAGTGKSSLITALASHFIMTSRKVLVVSKSDHAVDVITDKLNNLGAGLVALRGGKLNSQVKLASFLLDLLENKVDLNDSEKMNIFKYLFNQDGKKLLKSKRIKFFGKELFLN